MVSDKLLSLNYLDYLRTLRSEKITTIDQLLSNNVLAEQGAITKKLAYAHNILFDYAVSKLVIEDSAGEIISFIGADKARPFYLRPSFIYFFSRLWYLDQDKFWEVYTQLSSDHGEGLSLFNKLIPSTVIAKEFDSVSQLRFLDEQTDTRVEQTRNILQALRFIKEPVNKLAQASFLRKLATELEIVFIWDFAIILEQLIDDPKVRADAASFAACGEAARNLMDFLLIHRVNPNFNLDQIASYRGTTMVAKTYNTNAGESRVRLEKVLAIMNEPGFPIAYVSNLTDSIKEFYQQDPAFAVKIYKAVFAHKEEQNVATQMHTGVLMSFMSNRIDEFEMCYFRLQQFFPRFIEDFPERAIPLGLEIVNDFVHRKYPDGIVIPKTNKIPAAMIINGVSARYEVDASAMWYDSLSFHKPINHTLFIFEYFSKLINGEEFGRLEACLKQYFADANVAYNWKRLLIFGSTHVQQVHNLLFELLLQPAILYWSDTVYEAAQFFELSATFYTKKQLHQIEKAILAIDRYLPKKEKEKAQSRILRLLTRIPKSKLQEEASKLIVGASKNIRNEPVVTFSSSSELMTTEMFLTESGVDIKDPVNEELLALHRKIESFTRMYLNEYPDEQTFTEPYQIAAQLFAAVKNNAGVPERLAQTILQEVAGVVAIVLKSTLAIRRQEEMASFDYTLAKEIVLFCLAYHTDSDTYAEGNYSPGSSYSSTPRSEAADALPHLYAISKDADLLPLMQQYSVDRNAVTRFHVLKSLNVLYGTHPTLFWEIVNERLSNETDTFTKAAVIRNLDNKRIFESEQPQLVHAFELAQSEIAGIKGNNSFLENYLTIAMGFYRKTGNERIYHILQQCLEANLAIGKDLIFHAFQIIEPANFYRNYTNLDDVAQSQRIIELLLDLLKRCETILVAVRADAQITEDVKEAFNIFDTMIQRVYFSMQVNERLNRIQRDRFQIRQEDKVKFYFFTKPLLQSILDASEKLGNGHMQGHTAHYFIEIMREALKFDIHFSLAATTRVTEMTVGTAYTFDRSAIQEVVRYTEKLLADHKSLLAEPKAFSQIMTLLNIYVESGWPEALELLWKLDEVFR